MYCQIALADNLSEEGVDFDEIEKKLFPDSTFVYQMIQHLDDGGYGEDMISAFLLGAIHYSPELQDIFGLPLEE